MFDKFGRSVGYGQYAPGRDVEAVDDDAARQRQVIQSAVTGGMPVGGATPFVGAQQTLGAPPVPPPALAFTGGNYQDYLRANSQRPEMQQFAKDAEAYSAAKYSQPTSLGELGANMSTGAGSVGAPQRGPSPTGIQSAIAGAPYIAPAAGADLSVGVNENHATQMGMLKDTASDAMRGAQIGKYFGGVGALAGAGIGAGVGAIRGYLSNRTNDTKNEREQFAQSLGAKDSTALWQMLNQQLPPDQAAELQNRALNRIGKHDETANAQWQQDVQSALAAAKANPQVATAASAAPGGSAGGAMSGTAAGVAQAADQRGGAAQPAAGTSATPGQFRGMLQGFNADKLADPNKHDPKYDFARIAQDYPPTPDGLKQMAADPRFAQAGYKYVGDDKIQVPNGSVIDVGLSFGSGGGKGWAWQPTSGPDAAEGAARDAKAGSVAPPMNADSLRAAILGQAGDDQATYGARLRQQVLQALQATPGLQAMAKTYGQ